MGGHQLPEPESIENHDFRCKYAWQKITFIRFLNVNILKYLNNAKKNADFFMQHSIFYFANCIIQENGWWISPESYSNDLVV
jgi:hypothetical protein